MRKVISFGDYDDLLNTLKGHQAYYNKAVEVVENAREMAIDFPLYKMRVIQLLNHNLTLEYKPEPPLPTVELNRGTWVHRDGKLVPQGEKDV